MISKNKKRSFFSLIEVIIATALLSVLMATVMFFYKQIAWMNSEMEKVERTKFVKSYVENRLAAVIPKTTSPTKDKQEFYFFTRNDTEALFKNGSSSLIFTFNNGINLNKPFSNAVLGRLWLDKEGRFILSMWPVPKRWIEEEMPPIKSEILLENVESLSYEFYVPPEKNMDLIAQVNPDKEYLKKRNEIPPGWHKEWKNDYNSLPALVKLHLKMSTQNEKESNEVTFIFPLSCSNYFIVYD